MNAKLFTSLVLLIHFSLSATQPPPPVVMVKIEEEQLFDSYIIFCNEKKIGEVKKKAGLLSNQKILNHIIYIGKEFQKSIGKDRTRISFNCKCLVPIEEINKFSNKLKENGLSNIYIGSFLEIPEHLLPGSN